MKQIKWLAVLAYAAVGLAGCETTPTINEKDLSAYWYCQESNTYMRIMHDTTEMKDGKYLGYEWKTGESNENNLQTIDYHKNGWFEWSLQGKTLSFDYLSDLGSIAITRDYTITLTSTTLVMTRNNESKQYTKTTQPK